MPIRFISLAILLSLPAVSRGQPDSPSKQLPLATADELKPFTVTVVDKKTGKPVTEFSYVIGYKAPGRVNPLEKEWRPRVDSAFSTTLTQVLVKRNWQRVDSPFGTFVVQVPPACLLGVGVQTPDYLVDSVRFHEILVRSTDNERRAVVQLERGATVHGTVRDATTRNPIAGVTVCPNANRSDIYLGGEERRAKSDKDGKYELHGVNLELGVSAFHPENGAEAFGVQVKRGEGMLFDIDVTPLDHCALRGTVRDASGQPLEGVTISASGVTTNLEDEKHLQTARDGTYSMQGVLGLPGDHYIPPVTYSKEGYVTQKFVRKDPGKNALVVLQRQVPLEGQVLGPDGQPVKSFAVSAGPGGASPAYLSLKDYVGLKGVERVVDDTAGRFKIWLDREGSTWVGVRAAGYASWEVLTDIPRKGRSLIARLEPGATITGRILVPPGGLAKFEARLVQRRNPDDGRGFGSSWKVVEWTAVTAAVAADGTLRFDHVQPGRYTLSLEGPVVTPRMVVFDVTASGLDLGQVRLAGRGRVQGRAFRSKELGGGVLPYADGRALWIHRPFAVLNAEFTTDEDGRFSVGGLPLGIVYVGFPRQVFNEEVSDDWAVQVCEDQTTEVRMFDPVASRPLPLELRVGDGSKARNESGTFRIDLIPLSRQPLSFAASGTVEFDAKGQGSLADVSPGAYRLRVMTRPRQFGTEATCLHEQEITVPPDSLPIKVSLGGGSITGRFLVGANIAPEDKPVTVGAVTIGPLPPDVDVIAVDRLGKGPIRRTKCDADGDFYMSFVDPGLYTLFAHYAKGAWSRVDNVKVASDLTDVGEHPLARGGTIRGSISFRRPCPVPDEVIATGPLQVSLKPFHRDFSSDQIKLDGLCPGRWTITIRGGEELLATAATEIKATETVAIELAAEPEKRQ